MKQILRRDWLPERAVLLHLARLLPAIKRSKPVHASFLSQNIFRVSKKVFCDFYIGMELENEKTENVNENENKENTNVDEFQEYTFQQK